MWFLSFLALGSLFFLRLSLSASLFSIPHVPRRVLNSSFQTFLGFSSRSCEFHSSFHCRLLLCLPCISSLLLCPSTHPSLSLTFIFLPSSPLLEFFTLARWALGNSLDIFVPLVIYTYLHAYTCPEFNFALSLCFHAPSLQGLCHHPLCILLTCLVNVCWRNNLFDFSTCISAAHTLKL